MGGGTLGICKAMIVTISTSGGIGGFGLGPDTRVDLDKLPAQLRSEACEVLSDSRLAPLMSAGNQRGADRVTYTISVEQSGKTRTYAIPEEAMSPDMLDVIDALSSDK